MWRGICFTNTKPPKMKRFLMILALIPALSIGLFAQNQAADDIANLLKTGNASGLSAYFMNNVDLTILNNDDVYSKNQATQMTKRFFDENAPKSFTIKHEGKSKLDDHYRIGTLATSNGEFRVTYFLKNNDGTYLIKQLRIESNDRGF